MSLSHELEVADGWTVGRLLSRDGEAARDYARESLSAATRRAYQTDVDVFIEWCRERQVQPLPEERRIVERLKDVHAHNPAHDSAE